MITTGFKIGVALLLVIGTCSFRTARDADFAVQKAAQHESEGNFREALTWWQRGFQHSLSFQDAHEKSRQALERISGDALASGDEELALDALRAQRRGLLRRYWRPEAEELNKIETPMAALLPAESRRWEVNRLRWKNDRPGRIWAVVSSLGLGLAIAATILCAIFNASSGQTKNRDENGIRSAPFWTYLVAGLVGTALWIAGLLMA